MLKTKKKNIFLLYKEGSIMIMFYLTLNQKSAHRQEFFS